MHSAHVLRYALPQSPTSQRGSMNPSLRPALLSLLIVSLAGCGGGGGSSSNTGNTSNDGSVAALDGGSQHASMTMRCVEGVDYQCSGGAILRTDNGVALTNSGVQVYGRSTNETAPDRNSGAATGMMPASGGVADIQVNKDTNGFVVKPVLQLKDLNISWDRRHDRPAIIETFSQQQGRVQLDASGKAVLGTLPDSSDLNFYDWVVKGINGTQANYANNVYFPRADPPRCPPTVVPCLDYETKGFNTHAGNWRNGGVEPDSSTVQRLHSDGDLQAGDGVPGADGKGTPYPGFKGYRSFENYGLQYANLADWVTQDTESIVEWVGQSGDATVTVDFAALRTVVTMQNTRTFDSAGTPLPGALTANATMGAAGQPIANYLTGAADNGTLKGGLGGRFFGPVLSSGAGAGPAEIAGTFTLSYAATGPAAIGGFIARKQ